MFLKLEAFQEFVLRPVLFVLYVYDISSSVNIDNVIKFADDSNLTLHGKTIKEKSFINAASKYLY